MIIANTAIVAGIIFAITGFGFIIKNFFGNYIDSRKGYRSIIILISSILFTLCSFLSAFAGFDLENIFAQLGMNLTKDSIMKLNNQKMQLENFLLFYVIVIAISAISFFITYNKVRKERIEIENNSNDKWDLKKLKE